MQAAYDVALRRVTADFVGSLIDMAEVLVDVTDPDEIQYRFLRRDGTGHGSRLPAHEDIEAVTAELARPFQEDILESLWGPAWPVCPGHPHPAEPDLREGLAVWRCPTTTEVVGRIGSLRG